MMVLFLLASMTTNKIICVKYDFINYALGVTPEAASQWETYFREHPEQIADAEEAKAVLLAPADVACDFSLVENQDLKDRIVSSIKDFSNIL